MMTGDKVEKEMMVFAELSDLEMASKVRMLMRGDLVHEAVCVGARDRIMYLSQQLAIALAKVEELEKVVANRAKGCTIYPTVNGKGTIGG
jgi:hypothetical protein